MGATVPHSHSAPAVCSGDWAAFCLRLLVRINVKDIFTVSIVNYLYHFDNLEALEKPRILSRIYEK